MANKVGPLIKEARTGAGLTQEQLAKKVAGVTASDISKAERGEKELTQEELKKIAKITGVTQKSLLEAAQKSTYKSSAAKSTASKSSSGSKSSMQVTASERKLVELYRAADSDTKKEAVKLLKGELDTAGNIISSLIDNAVGLLTRK